MKATQRSSKKMKKKKKKKKRMGMKKANAAQSRNVLGKCNFLLAVVSCIFFWSELRAWIVLSYFSFSMYIFNCVFESKKRSFLNFHVLNIQVVHPAF